MQLSPRARILLTLVNDRTEWQGDKRPGKELKCYFVPHRDEMYSQTLKQRINVSSGGDASSLRALEHKGLIRRIKPLATGTERYYYAITEDGILALVTE